jgi:DNA helicase HerA-like ATPase
LNDEHEEFLNINAIEEYIAKKELDMISAFVMRCKLQLVQEVLYGSVVHEHISPLLSRILSVTSDVDNYIEISSDDKSETFLTVVSFRNLNQDAKKILSLLISKMYFDKHKKKKEGGSFHLIVDEAHNILSTQAGSESDSWKDYRLELFEEIIKEGRKFAFFLTLSSQRPADISPTILSQVHNFFLHKLVNERDLMIIDNSISTLDKVTKSTLPVLSQGVCIVSGTAVSMPITVKVNFIEEADVRPQSDTIDLVKIWKEESI